VHARGNTWHRLTLVYRYDDALADALSAIYVDPDWPRGYQRKAAALIHLKREKEAKQAIEDGLALDRGNSGLLGQLKQLGSS